MVHRSVLQWTRGESVPLSLYERTFFSVLHFHFMTAFQTRPKRRRVFPFLNNHRRLSKVLTTPFLTFFSTFTIRPCIPSLLHCPTGHECRRFPCQNRIIVHYDTSAMKRFLTSVSLQHEPKSSDIITLVKKTFLRTSIVRNFISRGVKMRISAREACVKPYLRTLSDIKKVMTRADWTNTVLRKIRLKFQ